MHIRISETRMSDNSNQIQFITDRCCIDVPEFHALLGGQV
jgi:hypothetical protein